MKIAFVVGSNDYNTSLYKATKDVANEIRQQGVSLDYIFWERNKKLKDNDKVVNIFGVSKTSMSSVLLTKLMKNIFGYHFYYYLFSFFFSWQLKRFIEKNNYDIVFFHGVNALPFVCYKGPSFIVLHSCKYENLISRYSGLKKKAYHWLYRTVFSNKRLLTVSNSAKEDLLSKVKANPLSIDTIYNGFNFKRMIDEQNEKFEGLLPEKFIMAAGRPDRTKRFDILIEAYARTKTKKTHKLVIFGEGKGMKSLMALSARLGVADDVIFFGYCSSLLQVYKHASLYVLSSDIEGLPTVIIESLVAGTPVVATDAGGVRELLQGHLSQYIVPCGDIEQLSDKIDIIMSEQPCVSWNDIAFLSFKEVAKRYIEQSKRLLS